MCFIRDEKGAAMIVALLVMIVLMLLGTALWQYSTADTIHVARDEQRMQAYYLARTGADAALQAWEESPSNAKPLGTSKTLYLDAATGEFTENPTEEIGHFTVTITELNGETIIESIGEVRGLTQKVTVKILSAYKYGHPGWYDETSGQFNTGGKEPGAIIFRTKQAGNSTNALKNPNKTLTFCADGLFFDSPLGMPLNGTTYLCAETIVFDQPIGIGKNGELFLTLPEGVTQGVVFFNIVTNHEEDQLVTFPISNNAYYFYDTIDVHNLISSSYYDELIEDEKLVQIPDPKRPSPEAFKTITWY